MDVGSCCYCFSHSAHWLLTRKKLRVLYTVANPARGLLNRGKKKKKVWQRPPPARCSFGENEKQKNHAAHPHVMSRRYASQRYAGGLGPSRVRTRIPTTRRLRLVGYDSSARPMGVASQNSTLPCAIETFPVSLPLSSPSPGDVRPRLHLLPAASSSSSLHAAMNLRPPSVTTSTQTSAFNAIVFQSPVVPNARMLLCTQSVHSFSFLPRPLRTAPSRFPNMIRFGNRRR